MNQKIFEGKTQKLNYWHGRKLRKINSAYMACSEGLRLAASIFVDRQAELVVKKEEFIKTVAVNMGTSLEDLQKLGLGITIRTVKGETAATIVKINKPENVRAGKKS